MNALRQLRSDIAAQATESPNSVTGNIFVCQYSQSKKKVNFQSVLKLYTYNLKIPKKIIDFTLAVYIVKTKITYCNAVFKRKDKTKTGIKCQLCNAEDNQQIQS